MEGESIGESGRKYRSSQLEGESIGESVGWRKAESVGGRKYRRVSWREKV